MDSIGRFYLKNKQTNKRGVYICFKILQKDKGIEIKIELVMN
jgi:hypothetical protein